MVMLAKFRSLVTSSTFLSYVIVAAALVVFTSLWGVSPWFALLALIMFPAAGVLALPFASAEVRMITQEAVSTDAQIVDAPIIVSAPSGTLVLSDLLSLRAWEPVKKFKSRASTAKDLILSGPKAWLVSRRLGLPGPYLYDVPGESVDELVLAMKAQMRKRGVHMEVSVNETRISPAERVTRAVKHGPALFNLRDKEMLAIPGESVSLVKSWFVDGSLSSLDLMLEDTPVNSFQIVGAISFSSNVMALGDSGALEEWDSVNSRDGLYDFLVRGEGRTSALMADGVEVEPNTWRWSNLTSDDMQQVAVMFAQEDPEATAVVSPHGDEFFIIKQLGEFSEAARTLGDGSVHGFKLNVGSEESAPKEAVVSVGHDKSGKVVRVRLSFGVDTKKVFFLPPPSWLELAVTPIVRRKVERKRAAASNR